MNVFIFHNRQAIAKRKIHGTSLSVTLRSNRRSLTRSTRDEREGHDRLAKLKKFNYFFCVLMTNFQVTFDSV